MAEKQPKLTPNRQRIAEAILFMIARAEPKKRVMTQYDLVKALWLADTWHLTKYGRPITYDNYVAMEHGPVPSEAFDMLKPDYQGDEHFEVWPLWLVSPYRGRAYAYYSPQRPFNSAKLSQSEIHELTEAQDLVWTMGFEGTRDFTHKHPAYVAAWREGESRKSFPMDYMMLLDQDEEAFTDIVFASKHQ